MTDRSRTLPVGVVVRERPGVTRWARRHWQAVALILGAGPGAWQELRREGDVIDWHAATAPLTLWRTDTEAYLTALNGKPPSAYAILRRPEGSAADARPDVLTVTASAYEAQDYADNGEDIVERLEMPPGLEAWVAEFVAEHHVEEPFVKRKRRRWDAQGQGGRGDPRIRQTSDVYRAPTVTEDER